MDGNNSLKRIRTTEERQRADVRTLSDSDYYLPAEYVDGFANEVKSNLRKGPQVRTSDSDDVDEDDGLAPSTDEGDPTDGQPVDNPAAAQDPNHQGLDACTKNWKAAADDESKRMWAIFDEAGVFMSACRHGFILWIIDMIRSGEL